MFAVAILVNLSMSFREATTLFVLFAVQFVAGAVGPDEIHDEVRIITAIVYLVLGVGVLVRSGRILPKLLRDGFRRPYADLAEEA